MLNHTWYADISTVLTIVCVLEKLCILTYIIYHKAFIIYLFIF